MTEAIYKVGDILEFTEVFPRQLGLGLWTGPTRGLVVKISDPGYEYISYRLLLSGSIGDARDMTLHWAFEKNIVSAAKRVGHIDISALMFMENDEPDYATFFTAATIAQAADLRNENDKIKKENKRLSNENRNLKTMNDELRSSWIECCTSCKQTEESKKVMDENEVLKRENEELRAANKKLAEENTRYLQSMTCAEKRIAEAAKRVCAANEYCLKGENKDD